MSSLFSCFEDTSYSSVTQWLEAFLNHARENGWYALYPSANNREPGYHQVEFIWETDEFYVWRHSDEPIIFPGHNIPECAKYIIETIFSA